MEEQLDSVLLKYYKETGRNPETDGFPVERLNEWASDSADAVLNVMMSRAPSVLRSQRRYRSGFESRLRRVWGHALDLLEAQTAIAFEAGESFNSRYRPEAAANQDHTFEVLVRLHARGCQIGSEVLALLTSGFADGAHARWRTLHELAVVAYFIKERADDQLAERYLLHSKVESLRAAVLLQKHHEALGEDSISEDVLHRMQDTVDRLCVRFGVDFRSTYGWAARSLGKSNPTFADVEGGAGLDHMRPWYKMASHNVHANPKGIQFRLGYDGDDLMLAGPSNKGLADPGQYTALSLLQLTVVMLNLRVTAENLIGLLVLSRLTDEVREAFLDAHHKMGESKRVSRAGAQ
jgi:hypothetical protein